MRWNVNFLWRGRRIWREGHDSVESPTRGGALSKAVFSQARREDATDSEARLVVMSNKERNTWGAFPTPEAFVPRAAQVIDTEFSKEFSKPDVDGENQPVWPARIVKIPKTGPKQP